MYVRATPPSPIKTFDEIKRKVQTSKHSAFSVNDTCLPVCLPALREYTGTRGREGGGGGYSQRRQKNTHLKLSFTCVAPSRKQTYLKHFSCVHGISGLYDHARGHIDRANELHLFLARHLLEAHQLLARPGWRFASGDQERWENTSQSNGNKAR